jgi:hypothetical protein
MSIETAALVERLWQAEDLDEEAAHAGRSLTPQEFRALQEVAAELETRVSSKRIFEGQKDERHSVATLGQGQTVKGLLILLVLATYHSDTLLFLPPSARHKRALEWAERTGFPLDFVKEAAILGPHGLRPLLEAA